MLDRLTAPISRILNGILSEGGEDLEFIRARNFKNRTPDGFVSCFSGATVAEIEKGYARIRASLLKVQLSKSRQHLPVQRITSISQN